MKIVLRTSGIVAVVVALYYVLPLSQRADTVTVLQLGLGLAIVMALLIWQTRAIIRSDHPRLRAAESLALAAPLFLLLFAATYYLIAQSDTAAFGEPLSRTDTLYFSVTVFATVGFGDIAAKTEEARLLVTGQMIGNMIFIGLGLRALLTASQIGLQRQQSSGTETTAADES